MTASMRAATDIARQARLVLAFEPEVNNVVDSAQKARRLMDEIGSPHLKVTFDAANLFHTGELPRMKEILDEAFALIGRDVVLAHAKDLDHDGDLDLLEGGARFSDDRIVAHLIGHGRKLGGEKADNRGLAQQFCAGIRVMLGDVAADHLSSANPAADGDEGD